MILRTLAAQLRKGKSFSLISRSHGNSLLTSNKSLAGIKNVRSLHQQCRETLCKRNPRRRSVLVFLVGPARYAETVEYLREVSFKLCKLLMRQCEVHIGLRIRNFIHFYCFYSRIWGEEMASKMFAGLRKSLMSRTKFFLCSTIPLSLIDFKNHIISDEKLDEVIQEYTTVNELCSATIHCEHCLRRKIIDRQFENMDYCNCKGKLSYTDGSCVYESWQPFIERENTIVWRKEHDEFKNMYCYKVYGKYADISANSFAEVQLNTINRMTWDHTALQLSVEGSDSESNTDLLYWKVKFPKFFANRDYIFKRRFRVNENRKEIIIFNEAIQHENHPKIAGIHRVEDYWAAMIIRADSDFHLPGMTYTLVYFDNPGTTLPNAITNLIASKSFPDFLCNVYKSACQLQKRWDTGEDIYVSLPDSLRHRRNILTTLEEPKTISEVIFPEVCTSDGLKDKLKELIACTENNQDHAKFPISFRNSVIDLLEAAEVISPDLNRETFLSKKIHEFMEKQLSEEQSILVRKLLHLAEKTAEVLRECAAKKEDSLRVMHEMEKRNHYKHIDESAQQMLTNFFTTINKTLQTDKDLRTGKLLNKPEKSNDLGESHKSDVYKSTHRTIKSLVLCPCCDKPFDKPVIKSNKHLENEQCPNCSCNMKDASQKHKILPTFHRLPEKESTVSNDFPLCKITVEPNKYLGTNMVWYFSPIFSTWKLILWLLSPWSNSDI